MNTYPGIRPKSPVRLARHDDVYWKVMQSAYRKRLKVWNKAVKTCRPNG